jgi:hypothetical protein
MSAKKLETSHKTFRNICRTVAERLPPMAPKTGKKDLTLLLNSEHCRYITTIFFNNFEHQVLAIYIPIGSRAVNPLNLPE